MGMWTTPVADGRKDRVDRLRPRTWPPGRRPGSAAGSACQKVPVMCG